VLLADYTEVTDFAGLVCVTSSGSIIVRAVRAGTHRISAGKVRWKITARKEKQRKAIHVDLASFV